MAMKLNYPEFRQVMEELADCLSSNTTALNVPNDSWNTTMVTPYSFNEPAKDEDVCWDYRICEGDEEDIADDGGDAIWLDEMRVREVVRDELERNGLIKRGHPFGKIEKYKRKYR